MTALLTYCDDAAGERVVLTPSDLGGWAARVANLLVDGCGLGAGSRVALLLPPHWQTAAVVLGAWSVGVEVAFESAATGGLTRVGPGSFDAVFVSAARADSWLEDVPAAPHRFVLFGAVEGYTPFLDAVLAFDEDAPDFALVPPDASATVDGTTFGAWRRLADELAATAGLDAGDRVLFDAAEHEHPVWWLLTPLAAGASVVLCTGLAPGAAPSRAADERAILFRMR